MSTRAPLSFNGFKGDMHLSSETEAKLRQAHINFGRGVAMMTLQPPKYEKRKSSVDEERKSSDAKPTSQVSRSSQKSLSKKPSDQKAEDSDKRQKMILAVLCAILLPSLFMLL